MLAGGGWRGTPSLHNTIIPSPRRRGNVSAGWVLTLHYLECTVICNNYCSFVLRPPRQPGDQLSNWVELNKIHFKVAALIIGVFYNVMTIYHEQNTSLYSGKI